MQLRNLRLREFGNLLMVYTVSQWRSHCGILTPGTHASLLFLYLALGRIELKESDRIISLGRLPQKAQGRSCPPPRGFPPCPRLDTRLGTSQTRQAAFSPGRLIYFGSQVCSEGCEQPSPGKVGQRPARSNWLAVWPWVDLASLCICPTTRTLAIERMI